MARVTVTDYSFNWRANTVTLNGLSTVVKEQVVSIYNVTRNRVIYLAGDAPQTALSGKTLTLPGGAMLGTQTGDELSIVYETDSGWGAPTTAGTVRSVEGRVGDVDVSMSDISGLTEALAGKAVALAAPGGDRLRFYDLSAGGEAWLQLGTNLAITGTVLNASGAGGGGGGDMLASIYDPTAVTGDAFNQDNMVNGTTNKNYTATEKTKLAGVATGATANATDAQLRDRSTHTGTQSADSLTDGTTNKAFLATERTKLTGVATGATANDTDANLKARANHTGTQSADTITDGSTNKVLSAAMATKLSGIEALADVTDATNVAAAGAFMTATGTLDDITVGTTNKAFTATEKTKLSGIATGATANDTDANLKARANHTGTQTASTISDFSTAADARISAAVGVSVQAFDSDLSAFAAKTAPSGAVVGTTDTQTISGKTLTNPTVNNYTEGVVANGTVTTAVTFDLTNGTIQTVTLTASTGCTATMPTAVAGKSFIVPVKQAAATGNGTITFTGVKWPGSTPVMTATAGKLDLFSFWSDGTNWYGSYIQGFTY